MKMQMLGSLILCSSVMVGSGSQSEPIADDKKCANGLDDWRFPSTFRKTCKGGCDKTACDKAHHAQPDMGIEQCYTTAQLGEDGSLINPHADPAGCNYGSDANTCAIVDGKCVYADWYPGSPLEPKTIIISYKPKNGKAAGLAATSNSDDHEYRLILTDEKKPKLRMIAVDANDTPLDDTYAKYTQKKQVWKYSSGGVFNAAEDHCLQITHEGCSGGDYCLRAWSDEDGVSCTQFNSWEHIEKAMEDIWTFQQDGARISGTAKLCMGKPFNGVEGKYFKSLHAADFHKADDNNCDKGWTAKVISNGGVHNELLDSQTTLPATCESCRAEGDVKHFLCATALGCKLTPSESVCNTITGGTWCEKPSQTLCTDDGTGKALDEFKDIDIQRKKCHGGCKAEVCEKKMHEKDDEGHYKAHNTCVTPTGQKGCNYAWDGSPDHTCAELPNGECVYAYIPSMVNV